MIHPNRTSLLRLKRRREVVSSSLRILKARRQALLAEFLASVQPFLSSRVKIRVLYYKALREWSLSAGDQGEECVRSVARLNRREGELVVQRRNILGVRYHDVQLPEKVRRPADGRNYDITGSGPHLEEAGDRFEEVVEALFRLAAFETRIRRLGEEILRVSRRTRVLEERVLPSLTAEVRATTQYIAEREREEYFRLKKFKNLRGGDERRGEKRGEARFV
ncbi:MAG: V-type ATP synthase subunit D [Desulfobulbaceae bacterium]